MKKLIAAVVLAFLPMLAHADGTATTRPVQQFSFGNSTFTWTNAQTFRASVDMSSLTIRGNMTLIGGFTGAIPSTSVASGVLGASVIASSVAVNKVGPDQLVNTAVTAGSYGGSTQIPSITVDADGRVTSIANNAVSGTTQWSATGADIYYPTGRIGVGNNSGNVLSRQAVISATTQTITGSFMGPITYMSVNRSGVSTTRNTFWMNNTEEPIYGPTGNNLNGVFLSDVYGRADVSNNTGGWGMSSSEAYQIAVGTSAPGFTFTHVNMGTGSAATAVGAPLMSIGFAISNSGSGSPTTVWTVNNATGKDTKFPNASMDIRQDASSTDYAVRVSSADATPLFIVSYHGLVRYPQKTAAQIKAFTPQSDELGAAVVCTDCASPYSVCYTTGTTIQGLRLGTSGTTECK